MDQILLRRRLLVGIVFGLLSSSYGGGGSAAPAYGHVDVSGTWDAHFSGTVEDSGGSQTDDLILEIQQNGTEVSGTLQVAGHDITLSLSGEVLGSTFKYTARGNLSSTCEVTVLAEATVDEAEGRLEGAQTQSTCEGTAVGEVTALRR